MRKDGRALDEHRPLELIVDYTDNPLASVLCSLGRTRVLCTVSEEQRVPRWLRGRGEGWVTAEYSMLPAATDTRNNREAARGKLSGRTMEIQRLIGRSLRAVVDLQALGERSLWVDCDVLQADGGTRTASVTGAYVALALAAGFTPGVTWSGILCATALRRFRWASWTAKSAWTFPTKRIPGRRST